MTTGRIRPLAAFFAISTAAFVAAAETDPASWLAPDGKQESWIEHTKEHRLLLERLDTSSEVVKRWLPAVRRRCEVLAMYDQIDRSGWWKQQLYAEHTRILLEDLAAGQPPFKRFAGEYIPYVYYSPRIRNMTGTRIQLPPNYDPNREHQVFMYYKIGGSIIYRIPTEDGGWGKWSSYSDPQAKLVPPFASDVVGMDPDTFHIWSSLSSQVKGRLGQVEELVEITEAMALDFSISLERVFCTGFSDGGFNALSMGKRYPHVVAGILPEVANWQYYNAQSLNLFNVPTLVVDGWGDAGYVPENIGRFLSLSNLGYPIELLMNHHGHATDPYTTEAIYNVMVNWAKQQRRNRYPKHVVYGTWSMRWNRGYWVVIENAIEPALNALIDVQVKDNNRIEVETINVAAYHLELNDKLVDMARPVTVVTNGKESYCGEPKPDLRVVLRQLEGKMRKTPDCPGGMTMAAEMSSNASDVDQTGKLTFKLPGREWSWHRPDMVTPEEDAKVLDWVEAWWSPAGGIDDKTIESRHLMMLGRPERNSDVKRIAVDLPVKFEPGKIIIGRKVYDRPETGVRFVCANPLNPTKLVLIFAFNDFDAAAKTNFYGLGEDFFRISPWGLRQEGDCQVWATGLQERTPFIAKVAGAVDVDYYTFSSTWGPPDPTAVGEALEFFDADAVCQLKAEAIKEATGADVGLVQGYPPGYNRWKTCLEKGPITVNDIAATNAMPEYVITAEVTAEQLTQWMSNCRFTTEVPVIEDRKTFRIAGDYGLVNYGRTFGIKGLSKSELPPPLMHVKNERQFADTDGVIPTWSNVKQTRTEVAQAVIDYVRKRGKISPAKKVGDLEAYLRNPQTHDYPQHDWLHFCIDYEVGDAKSGQPRRSQVLAAFGFEVQGASADEPRPNSKHFAMLNLAGKSVDFSFRMQELNGQLPLAIEAKGVKSFSLEGDPENGTARLLTGGEGRQGEIRLCKLTFTNKGNSDINGIHAMIASVGSRHLEWQYTPWKKHLQQENAPEFYYRGFVDDIGGRGNKYQSLGIAFVYPDQLAEESAVYIPGLGYAMGTIGFQSPLAIPAGESVSVPLVVMSAYGRDPTKTKSVDLPRVMAAVKDDLLEVMVGM